MTLIMTHGVLHLNFLVGGLTPLKNISQIWLLFPIYGKINSCSKPPTSYLFHHPWTQQFLSGSQLWADATDAAGPKTAPDTLRPLVSKPHLRHAGCFMVSWPRCQITRGSWSSGWAGLMSSVCSLSIKKMQKKLGIAFESREALHGLSIKTHSAFVSQALQNPHDVSG